MIRVTAADAVIALQMAVSGEHNDDADVDRDSSATSPDVFMLRQAALGTRRLIKTDGGVPEGLVWIIMGWRGGIKQHHQNTKCLYANMLYNRTCAGTRVG